MKLTTINLNFLLTALIVAYHARLTDSCTLESPAIFILNLRDNTTGTFWNGTITSGAVSNPNFTSFAEVFEVTLTPDGGGSTLVEFSPGPQFEDYVDVLAREVSLQTSFTYVCDSNTQTYVVGVYFIDTNNKRPEFNKNEISLSITSNWDKNIAINWNEVIRVSDADLTVNNTVFELTLVPDVLNISRIPLWIDGEVPQTYDTDIKLFLNPGEDLEVGTRTIEVTASDGNNTDTKLIIQLTIDSVNVYPPKFDENAYHLKLSEWPKAGDPLDLPIPIKATDPDDSATVINYFLNDLNFLEMSNPTNPEQITFSRDITEEDNFPIVIIGQIQAEEDISNPQSSSVPLIIEFPLPTLVQKQYPVFSKSINTLDLEKWPEATSTFPIGGLSASIPSGEKITFTLTGTVPDFLEFKEPNIIAFTENVPEGTDIGPNNVLLLEVTVTVKEDDSRKDIATIAVIFPERTAETSPTTTPTTTFETSTSSVPPETSSTTINPDPTSCPPCISTTAEPVTCSSTTEPVSCPTTCDPCPGTSEPTSSTDCPSTNEPTFSTSTISSTSTTCDPCPITDPSSCSTVTPPVTCEACTQCPITPDPSTGTCPTPEPCPITDPSSCSTVTPPVTCEACTECPITPDPSTGTCPTPEPCPITDPSSCPPCLTTQIPIFCPSSTTPPPVTCEACTECPLTPDPSTGTCPTVPPVTCQACTECPLTPDPSTGTCPPITCPPTTCQVCTECPLIPDPSSGTCPPCPNTPEDCPETCPECSSDSKTGLVAGITVVSVLLVGSLGAAAYFFWRMKSLAKVPLNVARNLSIPRAPRDSFSPGRNAQPDVSATPSKGLGWDNPSFADAELGSSVSPASTGQLEQVLSHPEPVSASNPYLSSLSAKPETSTASTVKSALAKPKEIQPDYEEGLNLNSSSHPESDSTSVKPKSGGVKIADEVEIINDTDELIQDSDESESEDL